MSSRSSSHGLHPKPPGEGSQARPRSPRVLFVGRSIGHFSYYETVLAALLKRHARVELLLDEHWSQKWIAGIDTTAMNEFIADHPDLGFDWLLRRSDRWRDQLFALRELRAFRSYLVRKETTPFYIKRWREYLTPEWKKRMENAHLEALLRSPLAEAALKAFEAAAPPDVGVVDFIKRKAPDLVIASPANLRFSEEVEYVKAAKRLGIPVACVTISWDNLSTKGLFYITPDKLFVWNDYQLQDALEIQHIPRDKLSVAGSPFFDKWFAKPKRARSRAAFCKQAGFDPHRPILLYLGSSKNIAKNECWFVQTMHDRLKASEDPWLRSLQILVRPHPANDKIYDKLDTVDARVWPPAGVLPETQQGMADMRDSFRHAEAAVGINTSAMIDSVLADLPTYSVLLSRYAQTQSDSKHFKYLEQAEALHLCKDLDAFWKALSGLHQGVDPKAPARRAFAQSFARPQGLERTAGDVIAEQALAMVR